MQNSNCDETLSEVDKKMQSDIQMIANEIIRRRLEVPAIFLFESLKPLCGLAHAALDVVVGMLGPLVRVGSIENFKQIIRSRESVEMLILTIEEKVRVRK